MMSICGLRSKLSNAAFEEECCRHNILCFMETLLDDTDSTFITTMFERVGFNAYLKNRDRFSKHDQEN